MLHRGESVCVLLHAVAARHLLSGFQDHSYALHQPREHMDAYVDTSCISAIHRAGRTHHEAVSPVQLLQHL